MSRDSHFVATGEAAVGFQTEGENLDVGADVVGKSWGAKIAALHGHALLVMAPEGNGVDVLVGQGVALVAMSNGRGIVAVGGIEGVEGKATERGGVGVTGTNSSDEGFGVRGTSEAGQGFIAGKDPLFHENAGVFGESDTRGVIGHGVNGGTGVCGYAKDSGCGVRAETFGGVALHAESFGQGLAARIFGNVEIFGRVTAADDRQSPGTDLLKKVRDLEARLAQVEARLAQVEQRLGPTPTIEVTDRHVDWRSGDRVVVFRGSGFLPDVPILLNDSLKDFYFGGSLRSDGHGAVRGCELQSHLREWLPC
jgi:hypothetical protein